MTKTKTCIILIIVFFMLLVACEKEIIEETPESTIFYSIINNKDETYTVKLFDHNEDVIDETTVPIEM